MTKKDPPKTLHEIWSHLTPLQRKWLRIQGEVFYAIELITLVFHRVDLWLFPPLGFVSVFIIAARHVPDHPIKLYVVLACAFMFATLTLLVIRPRRRKAEVHWVNEDV